jgi:hypothetical protein
MSPKETIKLTPEIPSTDQSDAINLEHNKPDQIKNDLFDFNKQIENRDKNKQEDFLKRLAEWDNQGATPENILAIRRGGTTKEQNTQNSLERHIQLSSAFTKQEKDPKNPNQNTYSINFRGNDLAEKYVGLGDILPPHAERVIVYGLEGQIITGGAIRKIHPKTGRIGYYDEATGAYIAVHSGFRAGIVTGRTEAPKDSPVADPILQRRKAAEEVTVYQNQNKLPSDFFTSEDDQKGVPPPKPGTIFSALDYSAIPGEPAPAARSPAPAAHPTSGDTSSPAAGTAPPAAPSIPESEQPAKPFNEYNPISLKTIPAGIPQKATEILRKGNPIGTTTVFVYPPPPDPNGKTYIARDEVHCHAPTDKVHDSLKKNHHGVTVYEARTA